MKHKQTAVQWLVEQVMDGHTSVWQKEIEQALKMEQKQLQEAWISSLGSNTERRRKAAKQYYNETFNQ